MTPLRTKGAEGCGGFGWEQRAAAKAGPTPPRAPPTKTLQAAIAPETSPARPSTRTQSRRHYGDPFAGAPRVGDGRLVPAGLLARSFRRIAPAFPPIGSAVALGCDARRLQLRGQPRLWANARTAFPLGPSGTVDVRTIGEKGRVGKPINRRRLSQLRYPWPGFRRRPVAEDATNDGREFHATRGLLRCCRGSRPRIPSDRMRLQACEPHRRQTSSRHRPILSG